MNAFGTEAGAPLSLCVASLNVFNPGRPGREENLASLLREARAEVVFFQELSGDAKLDTIAERAGLPYRVRKEGVGIASCYPLTGWRSHCTLRIPPRLTPLNQLLDFIQVAALEASLQVGGRQVRLFCVHWSHNSEFNRRLQSKRLERVLRGLPAGEVLIAGGDFNADKGSEHRYRLETAGLRDARAMNPRQLDEQSEAYVDALYCRDVQAVSRYSSRSYPREDYTDHPFVFVNLEMGPARDAFR